MIMDEIELVEDVVAGFFENGTPVLAFTIPGAVKASGIGRSTLYEFIKAGRLRVKRAGRRVLITREELKQLLDSLPADHKPIREGSAGT